MWDLRKDVKAGGEKGVDGESGVLNLQAWVAVKGAMQRLQGSIEGVKTEGNSEGCG